MISPRPRAARSPEPIKLPKLLLAEGATPAHFFEAMLKSMDLDKRIEIHDYGGNKDLRKYLKALAASAEFRSVKSIVVTADADGDADAARRSVQSAIASINLDTSVKLQIAILPNDADPGMIETLLLSSVGTQPHFHCIEQFFDCVEAAGVAIPEGPVRAKHLAQAYLATTDDPQTFPGMVASYRHVWPFDHSAFDWLKAMLAGM